MRKYGIWLVTAVLLTALPVQAHETPQERQARALFVEAEALRQSPACRDFRAPDFRSGYSKRPWSLLPGIREYAMLEPLFEALADVASYDRTRATRFQECLMNWREAAEKERTLLRRYPGTKIAVDLARENRLTPADVNTLIRRLAEISPHIHAPRNPSMDNES